MNRQELIKAKRHKPRGTNPNQGKFPIRQTLNCIDKCVIPDQRFSGGSIAYEFIKRLGKVFDKLLDKSEEARHIRETPHDWTARGGSIVIGTLLNDPVMESCKLKNIPVLFAF